MYHEMLLIHYLLQVILTKRSSVVVTIDMGGTMSGAEYFERVA